MHARLMRDYRSPWGQVQIMYRRMRRRRAQGCEEQWAPDCGSFASHVAPALAWAWPLRRSALLTGTALLRQHVRRARALCGPPALTSVRPCCQVRPFQRASPSPPHQCSAEPVRCVQRQQHRSPAAPVDEGGERVQTGCVLARRCYLLPFRAPAPLVAALAVQGTCCTDKDKEALPPECNPPPTPLRC
ncbi:uncharacterized protein CC84DRAFT_1236122 [Paraphaeosphaeria sporulosa]|uniref:Uncharacterized protein n=1 Tax=Paraphaeosphaeria sporulosa TaxID=1460663 RepID=A0A177CRZ9_9PLEO|nr:uncharacterized protein CC84DRAFT_1236122 [Paraphaeosphaeria sporulosa]OAG10066.1 hypothetical protein CC84DRAFT_1236122 [Paraphaeosphaeria sporulosa]